MPAIAGAHRRYEEMDPFFYGLVVGAVASPFLVYFAKLGYKKLKEKLGSAE